MTFEEAKNKLPDFLNEISNHGYTIKTVVNSYTNEPNYSFWVGDVLLGGVSIVKNTYEDGNSYKIRVWTATRVIMTDQVKFLKNKVSHDVQIKVNNTKWFTLSDSKEYKQFFEWETIIVKHLKTAFAKKRRMELDEDFE